MITVYGIKNCSTMKKAFDWLDGRDCRYAFHDYKKSGIERERLAAWASELGWEKLINTRGTTWRKLAPAEQANLNLDKALDLMTAQPSLIKRPVLDTGVRRVVGFDPNTYDIALSE